MKKSKTPKSVAIKLGTDPNNPNLEQVGTVDLHGRHETAPSKTHVAFTEDQENLGLAKFKWAIISRIQVGSKEQVAILRGNDKKSEVVAIGMVESDDRTTEVDHIRLLEDGGQVLIGRDIDGPNSYNFEDTSVSPEHASMILDHDTIFVSDDHSRNGTKILGHPKTVGAEQFSVVV